VKTNILLNAHLLSHVNISTNTKQPKAYFGETVCNPNDFINIIKSNHKALVNAADYIMP
jgi:hypothetical protein